MDASINFSASVGGSAGAFFEGSVSTLKPGGLEPGGADAAFGAGWPGACASA